MALQDLPAQSTINSPYPFGSPEYQAQILPFLEAQLQAQAEHAANARGAFYSGPAMADEQQAAASLAYQMAQQGAQQSEQEKILQEEQAFQQQMQKENAESQSNLSRQQAASSAVNSAIGGGTGALGQLAGLYAAKKLGVFGSPTPSPVGSVPTALNSYAGPNVDFSGAAGPHDYVSLPGQAGIDGSMPFDDLAAEGSYGMPGAGTIAGSAAAALPAAMLGSQAGLRTFGNGTEQKVGSGLGGLVGGGLGMMVGGPLGAAAGAGAGSFVGAGYGEHPGLLALGPLGLPIAAIPEAPHWLQQNLVNPINNAANDVGNFFNHLF